MIATRNRPKKKPKAENSQVVVPTPAWADSSKPPDGPLNIAKELRKTLDAKCARLTKEFARELSQDQSLLLQSVLDHDPLPDYEMQRALALVQSYEHQLAKKGGGKPPHSTTAIAVRPADAVAVDNERLSTEERRELKRYEAAIERGARAWVEMAEGLVAIQDGRLYRDGNGRTFDQYLDARRIDRSTAYALIKAWKLRAQLQSLKRSVPAIELDRESQYRSLPADASPSDLEAIVRRVARQVAPDADGVRRPTAAAIRQAVKAETTSPDDLKREKRRAEEAREARIEKATVARLETGNYTTVPAIDVPSAPIEAAPPSPQPFFPRCETIGQACCYLRSWISAMLREFPDGTHALGAELHEQWLTIQETKIVTRPTRRAK